VFYFRAMPASVHVRKLPPEAALRLFPDLEPPAAPRECPASTNGRHAPLDLSSLRYQPTPPFCAWCGAAMQVDRSA